MDDLSIKTYHEYGPNKMRVYFTKSEINDMKKFGDPSLILMGFKPMDRLKPYYNFKSGYFCFPDFH